PPLFRSADAALLCLAREVHVEDIVAERIRDELSVVDLRPLHPVWVRPDHQVGTGIDKSPRNGSLVSDRLAGVLLAPVRQDREDVDPGSELPDGVAHRIEIPGAELAQPGLHAKLSDTRFAPASGGGTL